MKTTTKKELIEFLENHYLNEDYTLIDLFKNFYAEKEFTSIDDLLLGIDEFFNFLLQNTNLIHFHPNAERYSSVERIIISAKEHIERNFSGSSFDGQKLFAQNVETMMGSKPLGHVLEVGSGENPISSFYLSKKAKRVSAMNPWFYLSIQAIKNMKVFPIRDKMSLESDISDYDIVVGRAPCTAIVPIVTLCKEANKPYIILLCECDLKPELRTDTDSLGWEQVLPQIDPNIRFYGQYALNFSLTPEQMKNIVIDYTRKPLKVRQKGFWTGSASNLDFDPDFPEFY